MEAGRLDRRITFEQEVETGSDDSGQPVTAWQQVGPACWAQKIDAGARQFFESAKENVEQTTTFKLRWRDDVTQTMRIVCEGAVYEILPGAIKELGRREGLEIIAVATRV